MAAKSRLQNELKKNLPFNSLREEALLNIMRTSDRVENRLGKTFRDFGLTASQYNVLRILRGAGEPLPALEIASRLIQVVPAITGLVDRLEKQSLVIRRRCTEDRRVVYVEITKKALKIVDSLDQPLTEIQDELLGHMNQKELKELIRLLEKARESLD